MLIRRQGKIIKISLFFLSTVIYIHIFKENQLYYIIKGYQIINNSYFLKMIFII